MSKQTATREPSASSSTTTMSPWQALATLRTTVAAFQDFLDGLGNKQARAYSRRIDDANEVRAATVVALRRTLREGLSVLHDFAPTASAEIEARIVADLATTRLPLVCPDCGGPLFVTMETVGPAYLTYERPESIECADYRCGASWRPDGSLPGPAA